MKRIPGAFLILLSAAPVLAGPPLVADDPNTVGRGHLEVIVAATGLNVGERTDGNAPILDLTYGLIERFDLTFVAGPTLVRRRTTFVWDSAFVAPGLKWEFVRADRWRAALSPAVLVDVDVHSDTQVSLWPVQAELDLGGGMVGLDMGYLDTHDGPNGWQAALYGGWPVTPGWSLLADVFSSRLEDQDEADLGFTVGADPPLSAAWRLLLSAGAVYLGDEARTAGQFFLGLHGTFASAGG